MGGGTQSSSENQYLIVCARVLGTGIRVVTTGDSMLDKKQQTLRRVITSIMNYGSLCGISSDDGIMWTMTVCC